MIIQIYDYECDNALCSVEVTDMKLKFSKNELPRINVSMLATEYLLAGADQYIKLNNSIKLVDKLTQANEFYRIKTIKCDETYVEMECLQVTEAFSVAACTVWNLGEANAYTTLTNYCTYLEQAIQHSTPDWRIDNNRGWHGGDGMHINFFGTDTGKIATVDVRLQTGDTIVANILETFGCNVIYLQNKIVFTYAQPYEYYLATYGAGTPVKPKYWLNTGYNAYDYNFTANGEKFCAAILPVYSLQKNDRAKEEYYEVKGDIVYNTEYSESTSTAACDRYLEIERFDAGEDFEWNKEIWGVVCLGSPPYLYDVYSTVVYERGELSSGHDYIEVFDVRKNVIGRIAATETPGTYNVPYIDDPTESIGTITITQNPSTEIIQTTTLAYTINIKRYCGLWHANEMFTQFAIDSPIKIADNESQLKDLKIYSCSGNEFDGATLKTMSDMAVGNYMTSPGMNWLYNSENRYSTEEQPVWIKFTPIMLYYKQIYSDYTTNLKNRVQSLAQVAVDNYNDSLLENIGITPTDPIEALAGGEVFECVSQRLNKKTELYLIGYSYDILHEKYSNLQYGYRKNTLRDLSIRI